MKTVKELIVKEFQLTKQELPDEEQELLLWLSDYTAYLLEERKEYLMSMMYRMDISEELVSHALSPLNLEATNVSIAKLILERQKERAFTKAFYRQEKGTIEDDLKW
ncbi:MAG: hypothetical protein AAF849_08805 [Bacteroidota bacterium]